MLRASPRLPLVEQKLLIHPEYLSSSLVLVGFMWLLDVFRVVFLSIWHFPLVIPLSVLLRFTNFNYPFGIFKLL